MTELNAADLHRLRRSRRRTFGYTAIVLLVLIPLLVALSSSGYPSSSLAITGVVLGGLAASAAAYPHRALLRELGLTPAESAALLAAGRGRRDPLDELPPADRRERLRRRRAIWIAVAVVGGLAFAGGGYAFLTLASSTFVEGQSLAPMGIAFATGSLGFLLALTAAVQLKMISAMIATDPD